MFRSVVAVVAGILLLTVTSFAIEAGLAAWFGPSGSNGGIAGGVAMTVYTLLCVAAGGYLTARLTPRAPLRHAAIMGAIQLLFTIGAMVQLDQASRLSAWLPGIVLMIPAALSGGLLGVRTTVSADVDTAAMVR